MAAGGDSRAALAKAARAERGGAPRRVDGVMSAASMGSFRLRELVPLGRGGMGYTYLGCTQGVGRFERLVVIKRLHEHLSDDELAARRLIKEAELAGFVRHANVVAVQQVDRDERGIFLVLDYVEGGSLRDLLDHCSGTIARPIALRILLDSLAGLEAIHETRDHRDRPLSILHRDVSPENILIGVDGVARLCDFGIAQTVTGAHTTTHHVAGKAPYLAPECLDGAEPARSMDLYSMGVTAYELFAGHSPWQGLEEAQILARALIAGVPPLEVEGLEPELRAIVEQACARNGADRYASAWEMSRAIAARQPRVVIASHSEVSRFVRRTFREVLQQRRREAAILLSSEEVDPAERSSMTRPIPRQGRILSSFPPRFAVPRFAVPSRIPTWGASQKEDESSIFRSARAEVPIVRNGRESFAGISCDTGPAAVPAEAQRSVWFWTRLALCGVLVAGLGFLCALGAAYVPFLAAVAEPHSSDGSAQKVSQECSPRMQAPGAEVVEKKQDGPLQ